MAKLSTKKLNISDYSKENQQDIAKLARSLNPLMDDLERLFRKGLTTDDNLPFQYVTVSTSVDSSGIPKSPIKITSSLTTTIRGCLVVNATSTLADPSATVGIQTIISGTNIEIKKVFGLPANILFDITILVVT